jgi:hypothetical protein
MDVTRTLQAQRRQQGTSSQCLLPANLQIRTQRMDEMSGRKGSVRRPPREGKGEEVQCCAGNQCAIAVVSTGLPVVNTSPAPISTVKGVNSHCKDPETGPWLACMQR